MIAWLVETLVATTGLMALVLLIRNPVRQLFGSHAAYALWLLPALRIGTLARAQLARLRRRDHELFDPRSIAPSPRDIWRLAGRRLIGSW